MQVRKKRFLAMLLCAAMLITTFPITVIAEDGLEENAGENLETTLQEEPEESLEEEARIDQYTCRVDENIQGGTLSIISRKSFARKMEETVYPAGTTECPSDPGDIITVNITPDEGYVLTYVYTIYSDAGNEVTTREWWGENTYTVEGVNTHMTVKAEFSRLDDCVCKANIFGTSTTYYTSVSEAAQKMRRSGANTKATFTMLSDTTEKKFIEFYQGGEITLDLDGYAINCTSGPVIETCAQLEIKDSNSKGQTHNFKVGEDGLWTLTSETAGAVAYENLSGKPAAGTIVTVTGGCITGGATVATGDSGGNTLGGGINNGTDRSITTNVLTLTGGNIIGNKVTASSGNPAVGGGVFNKGTFIMNGGIIAGNLVCGSTENGLDNSGGGVYNDDGGTFTLNGGSISYNTSTGDDAGCSGFGGGVNTSGSFTMKGATISYNTADRGGGIYTNGTSNITGGTFTGNVAEIGSGVEADAGLTLGGNVTITGHKNTSNKADNVFLFSDDALITIQDGYTGTCGVRRYENSGLGVISTTTDETYLRNFTSDNDNYGVRFNADSQLEISDSFGVDIQTVSGGTITANKTTAASAALIELTATPDKGYVLKGYEIVRKDTGEVYKRTSQFFMPKSDVSVTATFAKVQDITNGTPEHGAVTINGSGAATVTAKVGSEVTLKATADNGYALNGYRVYKTGDTSTTVTVTDGTFVMPDYDVTVTAEFVRAYGVTIGNITGNGNVSTDKTAAEKGETVTLTVTPKKNYDVSWVKVNGVEIKAVEGVYAFTMPEQDVTVTAAFEGKGDLTIAASVEDATTKSAEKDLTFTLELTGDDGKAVAGEYDYTTSDGRTGTIKSGGSITLKAGQTATIKDLPADIEYEVTEGTLDGFTVTAITGADGVINAKQTATTSFTNTYATTGSIQLKAINTLSGRTLKDGQFSFQLLDSNGTDVLRTATCTKDGNVTFGAVTYDKADDGKTYTYYIREDVPDNAVNNDGKKWSEASEEEKDAGGFSLNGYTYDSAKRKVKVSVTDNGNGTMTATPTYYDTEGAETNVVTIANTYHATGTATLSLWTTLKARDLTADEFTFGLYENDGTTPVKDSNDNNITEKNAADGTVEFELTYNDSDIGKTYTYVIKEIVPDETDETVVYDTTPWTFEVEVKDNGNGTLSFTQTVKDKDGKAGTVPVVKNTLKNGSLSITKNIKNGDANQEFKFIMKFTSPTGDDLDKEYNFSRNEVVPITQISNPTAQLKNAVATQNNNAASTESITPKLVTSGILASGTCGGCDWVIDASGCLTIKPTSGTSGTLANSTGASSWPWYDNRAKITSVVIEKGVIAGDSVQGMFQNHSALETADVSGLDTSNVKNMSYMFSSCSKLASLDVSTFNTSKVEDIKFIFNKCTALTTLTLRTETNNTFVTTSVTIMQKMFYQCSSLISLDLSNFDTSKVEGPVGMSDVFTGATALKSVTLGADFSFKSNDDKSSCTLPDASTTAPYTGKWKWNGAGKTVASLTAAELTKVYPDDTTAPAGTWVWEESTSYTVTFDANGGKGTMADMTCEPGTEHDLSANTFYRLGYTFTGWNTKADGLGDSYADGATIKDLGATTLYAQWTAEGPGKMTGGQMEVTLHGNECLTIEGIPAGTQYQVYEETTNGWVLVSQSGMSGIINPLETAAASFTNSYEATKTQATIVGTVTVDSSAGKVNARDYSFQLKDSGDTVLETVECGAGGSIAFSPLTYTAAGTYTYKVSQVIPSETGNIEYDEHSETVTVTVTDDGTGNLSASVAYDNTGVAFNNQDKTPTPQGTLQIKNTVEGTTATDKDFTFTIVTVNDGASETKTVKAKAGETVTVGIFNAGTSYTITETGIPTGYTLKSQTDVKGTIEKDKTATAVFTNTYAATGSATLEASKTLKGGTLTNGQFSFILKEGNTKLQTAGCAADGSVTFQPITYTAAGEYTYTISEEVPDDATNADGVTWAEATAEQKSAGGFFKNNIEYDSHTETVTVTATDNGEGIITTKVTYDADGAAFTNVKVYSVTAATCSNGTVSADKARAEKDEKITVTVTPDKGFKIDKVYYNDGTQHEITAVLGKYTFEMPANAVTVSATFVHEHDWSYSLSEDEATITATCGNAGCTLTDTSLTITAPANLTYDGKSHNATFGEAATFLGDGLPEISYEYKATEDGTYASASDTRAAGFYKASFTVGTGTGTKTAYVEYKVSKAQLAITGTTVDSKTYDGSTAATAHIGTVTGIVGKDTVTVDIDTANFADKNVGNGKGVTVSYKLTGADAGNYQVPSSDITVADISRRQLSISNKLGKTTIVSDKVYDGTAEASAKIGTVEGIVEGDYVTVEASATFSDKNVGDSKEVTVIYAISGDDSANYTKPEDCSISAKITAKTVNIAADDKTSYVGSDLVALTYSADDLVGGDTFTGDIATGADKNNVGKYDIVRGSLAISDGNNGNNYTINYTKGTYTVTDKELQTLKFTGVTGGQVAKTYGDVAFTETVSGAMTTVTYSSSDPTVATVDESTGEVTILKVGTTVIKATAEETAQYVEGEATYTLTVVPITTKLTITANSNIKVYDGKALTDDGYTYTRGVLIEGDALTAVVEGSMTNVGAAVNKVSSYKVMRGTADVTDCYNIETEDGVLQVTAPAKEDVNVDTETLAEVLKDVAKKYDDPKNYPQYAGKQFAVEFRTDEEVETADSEYIISKLADMGFSDKKVVCIDAELWLVISDEDDVIDELDIGDENESLVTATYKFDFTKKTDIRIFRLHTDSSGAKSFGEITSKPNELGEYIEIDEKAGTITVCAMKYSTFAVAYSEVADAVETNTGDSNDIMPYAMMLMLSVIGLAGYTRKRKE